MIKNNVYYEFFASIQVPNHEEVGYWIDLGADPHGNIIKFFDNSINRWVKLTDASSEYAVAPYIGNNGNWFIENRDTGIPAAGKNPYIGDNNNWFVFVPSENKYVDTDIMAKGLSAYEIAVKHGYVGTEEEWLQFLRQPALDAAAKALEATEKANKATDDAIEATTNAEIATENAQDAADRSNEIANNPPKIVNEEWYMYDELTKEYKSTGIKAIGDEFTIVKTYISIAAMEADYDNPEVGIGQFVMIDTGDVENPEDSRLYLKGDTEWKFISDLSGMQGIQGLSAYQVAVQEGFVGTQAEWIQSLKQPALDAADEALDAKAQVEATETLVKEAEALRVTAEEGRVDAETTRESNEAGRKSNETARGTAETARKNAEDRRVTAETARATAETTRNTNETTRQTQEGTRQTNETTRGTAEAERISNENTRKASETTRVNQEAARVTEENVRIANENARKTAETSRSNAEDIRDANEVDRQANEAVRETQEADRQTNTSDAITAVNAAKTATEAATTNAITAATNANTKADIAFDAALHPPIIENGTWWVYKVSGETGETREYVDTGVNATGDPGKSPIIQNSTWWTYNNETGKYEDTGIPIYNITKAQVEGVLTGDITTHHHDNRYYSKDNSYSKVEIDEALSAKVNASLLGSQDGVAQLDSTGKVPAAQLPSYVDDVLEYNTLSHFPAVGESGKIYIAVDTNLTYRWSGTGYVKVASDLALGETSATAYPGDKGKANADKLSTIESNAQVNKIEAVSARGNDLAINDKRVIVPEDIAISATEPTGDELIWINTAEDYAFNFDGYTQADADAKFVSKEVGKGLSENDYTTEDKLKVANSASQSDITTINNSLNTKVNKSGDTITGDLIMYGSNNKKITHTSSGFNIVPNANTDNTGIRWKDQTGTRTIAGIGATSEQGIITSVYMGWGGAPFQPINSLIAANNKFTYKNIPVMLADGSVRFTQHIPIRGSGNKCVSFENANGIELGYIGRMESETDGNGMWLRNQNTGNTLRLLDDGSFTYAGNKIWHAGNDGAGSGLDADTIDGIDSNDLFVQARTIIAESEIANGAPYKELLSGSYAINMGDCVNTLLSFKDTGSSASALQFYGDYDNNWLKYRTQIDNNRYTDWKDIAFKNDFNLELTSAYWFELDDNTATTVLNTGGNRDVLENLKRKFKRGLARSYGDNGAAFSPFKGNAYTWPDGSVIEVATGGVMHHMTYFPKYYHKTVEVSSNVWRTYISEIQIDDDYIEEPERLVATYESNVDSNKLTSQPGVVSQGDQTLATFVSQAKANGNKWGIQDYRIHSTIARMFCAYYASTDISTNNASIPCSGGTKNYNTDLNGGTKDLGNSDGKANTPNNEGRVSSNFLGLEDCYYGKWEFVQGVNVIDGKWIVYDGGSFPDKDVAALEAEGATNIRIAALVSTTNGYIKKVSHGRYGDVVPTEAGGSSTTYYADYYWYNTGNRIFLRSGHSGYGVDCGVFLANAYQDSSLSWESLGSRLAFYGDITIVDHVTFNKMS